MQTEEDVLVPRSGQKYGATEDGEEMKTQVAERFDYIMVFAVQNREKKEAIKTTLQSAGLTIGEKMSRDQDEIFLQITASPELFRQAAQEMELKKKLKTDKLGNNLGLVPFSIARERDFEVYNYDLFSSYERARIVYWIIVYKAEIDPLVEIQEGNVLKCFPLHDDAEKEELIRRLTRQWKPLSVDEIRFYFGEYIAIYYAWLVHYATWLILPSIIGLIMFIVAVSGLGFDNKVTPYYCIFVALWATFYLEFWKRRNSVLAIIWDEVDFTKVERVRPAFVGEERKGVYVDGEFLPLKDHPEADFVAPTTKYSSPSQKYLKIGAAASVLGTFITAVVIATLGIMSFRYFMAHLSNKSLKSIGGVIAGICNGIMIMIGNMLYRKVAVYFTNWENHRTESQWENSFIIKNCIFQFVNSYTSLFYVAFVKRFELSLFGYLRESCLNGDCIAELTTTLGTVFLTQIFVQQTMEVLVPYLTGKLTLKIEDAKVSGATSLLKGENVAPKAEIEAKFGVYSNTIDDFNEMAIQFGYITLFAAAFPLAPLAAFINNLVEMRTDMIKLLKGMQRPHPREAADIGSWYQVLNIIGYISIVTNLGLIFFTSKALDDWFTTGNYANKLWAFLIAEHIIFVAKYLISEVIPDTPAAVRREYSRRVYFRELKDKGFKTSGLERTTSFKNEKDPLSFMS